MHDRITTLITGKKGSGKTYYAVLKMIDALMTGDVVVSNIQLNWPEVLKYAKRQGVELKEENYRFIDTSEILVRPAVILENLAAFTTLVLDEVHLVFDSRAYAETAKRAGDFQTFLTQGRKCEVATFLITQASANLDSRMVRQATFHHDIANLQHMPFLGALLPIPVSIIKIRDSKGQLMAREYWWRPAAIAKCYDTRQKFLGVSMGGAPPVAIKGAKRRHTPYSVGLIIAGCLCVVGSRAYTYFKPEPVKPAKPAPVVRAAPLVAPPAVVAEDVNAPLVAEERMAFEAGLPRLRKYTKDRITLVDGTEIERGSPLGLGYVVRWSPCAGGVAVYTDSPKLQQIRIYERNPLFYRRSGNPGILAPDTAVPGGLGVVRADTPVSASVAPVFSPPLPFIPTPSHSAPAFRTSERIGEPTKVHGFSNSPY